ncbi:MAG: hypothetical protein AB7I27_16885 [Bacteriovoracaceae bacterium]
MGREVLFISWIKNENPILKNIWDLLLYISLFISFGVCIAFYFKEQKRRLNHQLETIESLLKTSAKEALFNLINLHGEFHNSKIDTYLTNFIEQIHLMQTLALSDAKLENTEQNLATLIEKQLENLKEIIQKKKLKLNFNKKDVLLDGSEWLLQNTVLSNIISHCLIYSKTEGTIDINFGNNEHGPLISFHAHDIESLDLENALTVNRRIEVAKRGLQIYQADLFLQRDPSGGFVIKLQLPK